MRSVITLLLLSCLSTIAPAQATLSVPGSFPTIQAAINAAAPGDTVEVAAGVYNENLAFGSGDIVVRSLVGPAATRIVAAGPGPVVRFNSFGTSATVLEGFEITGGQGGQTAGIFPLDRGEGGGIDIVDSSPTIRDCWISGNTGGDGASYIGSGTDGGAGGIQVFSGSPTIEDCRIENNQGGVGGTAIASASPALQRGGRGGAGGLGVSGELPSFLNLNLCRTKIIGNVGGAGGPTSGIAATIPLAGTGGAGGLRAERGNIFAEDVEMRQNCGGAGGSPGSSIFPLAPFGDGGAGGMELDQGASMGANNLLIVENEGGSSGGGAMDPLAGRGGVGGLIGDGAPISFPFLTGGVLELRWSTIAYNCAGDGVVGQYGGLLCTPMVVATAQGLIVQFNQSQGGFPGVLFSGNDVVSFSNVQGAPSSLLIDTFDEDPEFIAPASGNYRLKATSSSLDAGAVAGTPPSVLPFYDLDDQPRWVGSNPDCGCYERGRGPLGGTNEDLTLQLTANGRSPSGRTLTLVGSTLDVSLSSPNGTFLGAVPLIVGEIGANGFDPGFYPGFSALRFSPAAFNVFSGITTGLVLGPAPLDLSFPIPSGSLYGATGRIQGLAFSSSANNGILAATRAYDLIFR